MIDRIALTWSHNITGVYFTLKTKNIFSRRRIEVQVEETVVETKVLGSEQVEHFVVRCAKRILVT